MGANTDFDAPAREKLIQVLKSIAIENGVMKFDSNLSESKRNEDKSLTLPSSTTGISMLSSTISADLTEMSGIDPNDPEREKQILTEIEKFRLRQAQRDKYVTVSNIYKRNNRW
jgi:hypothetical protein